MSTRLRALAAYRNALRATNLSFKGDHRLLAAAQAQIKQGFYEPDESKTVDERIKHLEDVAKFLRSNIVQASKEPGAKRYHLNIHEETELGDNESIKTAKKTLVAQGGGCCGGGAALVN